MKKSTKITFLWQRILMTVVFITGALGVLFNKDESAKSEYLFICTQSAYFLIVSFLPVFLKKLELDIPDCIYIIFICFCLAHYFCGEILGFFVKIKWWDSLMHTFSGMLLALLSFSLINLLNKNSGDFKLNIWFMALFAFSLTITIGVLWEIFEYLNDLISGSNMQRAYVSTMNGRGEPLLGQAALADTMKDLILDSIGAAVVCAICIIAVKKNKLKVEDLSFIKKKKKVQKDETNPETAPVSETNTLNSEEVQLSLQSTDAPPSGNNSETETTHTDTTDINIEATPEDNKPTSENSTEENLKKKTKIKHTKNTKKSNKN